MTCFILHSFYSAFIRCCIFHTVCTFQDTPHVAPIWYCTFPCCTFLMLHSIQNALSYGSLPCCTRMTLRSFQAVLAFSCCDFFYVAYFCFALFHDAFFHVAFYLAVLYFWYIFWKYFQIQFCHGYKLSKPTIGAGNQAHLGINMTNAIYEEFS